MGGATMNGGRKDKRAAARLGRFSRRMALRGLGATAAGLALPGTLDAAHAAPDAGAALIGVGKGGRNAFEFIARLEQRGFRFTCLGFLTHVNGLEPQLLFTNGDPFEHTTKQGRITLVATATGTARSWLAAHNLIAVTANGAFRFYFNPDGGADFDDPDSFSSGMEIAEGSLRVQNAVTVTSPKDGLANGSGDLAQRSATVFTLRGRQYRLGHQGLKIRFTHAGSGVLLDPDEPHSIINVAGSGVVVRA